MRILLVEDHARLAMTVATGLRQAGMAVDVVFDGHDALAHTEPPITTWWSWTATFPGCMAMRCAEPW